MDATVGLRVGDPHAPGLYELCHSSVSGLLPCYVACPVLLHCMVTTGVCKHLTSLLRCRLLAVLGCEQAALDL